MIPAYTIKGLRLKKNVYHYLLGIFFCDSPREINLIFSGENVYNHLKVLTVDIGPRHGGPKKKKAAKYIEDYFKELGLKTRLESYPIYSFEDAEAELIIPGNEEKYLVLPSR